MPEELRTDRYLVNFFQWHTGRELETAVVTVTVLEQGA